MTTCNAEDIFSKLLVLVRGEKRGDEYVGFCPFHKDGRERHRSLYINKRKWKFYCAPCGTGGSVDKLLDYFNLASKSEEATQSVLRKYVFSCYDSLQLNKYILNQVTRGGSISRRVIDVYGLGWDSDKRLVTIPCITQDKKLLGVKGYLLPEFRLDRQKFTHIYPFKASVYGLHIKKPEKVKEIFIVGGEWDVLTAESLGISSCCSTAGEMTFSSDWLCGMTSLKRVYIALDSDQAGRAASLKIASGFVYSSISSRVYIIKTKDVYSRILGCKDLSDFVQAVPNVTKRFLEEELKKVAYEV